jgi:hypothetical protein
MELRCSEQFGRNSERETDRIGDSWPPTMPLIFKSASIQKLETFKTRSAVAVAECITYLVRLYYCRDAAIVSSTFFGLYSQKLLHSLRCSGLLKPLHDLFLRRRSTRDSAATKPAVLGTNFVQQVSWRTGQNYLTLIPAKGTVQKGCDKISEITSCRTTCRLPLDLINPTWERGKQTGNQ